MAVCGGESCQPGTCYHGTDVKPKKRRTKKKVEESAAKKLVPFGVKKQNELFK